MENFDLTPTESQVLEFIVLREDESSTKNIADYIESSTSAASHHLKTLRDEDLIEKKGDQTPQQFNETTRKGFKAFIQSRKSQSEDSTFSLRVHKVQVKIPIVEGRQGMETDGLEVLELKNNKQYLGAVEKPGYEELTYRITSQNLFVNIKELVYPPTARGVNQAINESLDMARKAKSILEEDEDLKFGNCTPMLNDAHFAFENMPLALGLDSLGEIGEISDDEVNLVIDRSTGDIEAEIEGPNQMKYGENLANNLLLMAKENLEVEITELKRRQSRLERALKVLSRQGLRNTVETVEKCAKKTVENRIPG